LSLNKIQSCGKQTMLLRIKGNQIHINYLINTASEKVTDQSISVSVYFI